MNVLDFHNHFYPVEYLRAIQDGPSAVRTTFDENDNPVLHYPGDYNVIVPGHRNIEARVRDIDAAGVERQILTFTSPGTHIEEPERAVPLARTVNDAFAKIAAEHERFVTFGTLPLCDPEGSVAEFERLAGDLGLRGVMVFSNVNGTALADERYWPLWERASEREFVVFIHPIHPVGVEAMLDYWLMPLVGFTMDTTLAASKLVFSGVVERFPGIKWVLGHLGGATPFLAERLDRGYEAFAECRKNISKRPSEYLSEFYYDSVNFDPQCLKLAIEFAGVDHLVAGSDYPHMIGSLEKMLSSIGQLGLSDEDKSKVLHGNAERLLGL